MKRILFILTGILLSAHIIHAQHPSIPVVNPSTMTRYDKFISGSNPSPSTPFPSVNQVSNSSIYQPEERSTIHRQNQLTIDEAAAHMQQQQLAYQLIRHGFPSWKGYSGTDFFYVAFRELQQMLQDSIPLNLNRAVFIIENAYLGNTLNYNDFTHKIKQKVKLCHWRLNDLKINANDPMARHMAIFSVLTDTLTIRIPGEERSMTHYPLQYNLDDYQSKQNYTSHFVTTLIETNKGQCYSIPLLYLLMAEEMNAEAYLAFAPYHSFVKIKDNRGAWYNLELTNRYILSDYHYMNHSYIKSEAIRNKLYLNPLNKREVIADMMVQLGRYFLIKYGYDPFVLECTTTARQYLPTSIDALIIEADYQTKLTLEIAHLLNAPTPDELKERSPQGYEHYLRMQAIYKEIDDSGYEKLPVEIYQSWLDYIELLKQKASDEPVLLKTIR